MNIAEHIARHLRDVYAGQNWTEVNLQTTLEDVSYEEAPEVTPASVNTIAGLVHHLAFWNRVMAQRIAGMRVEIPESNGCVEHVHYHLGQIVILKQLLRALHVKNVTT